MKLAGKFVVVFANPDCANMLGDMDLDFDNFMFCFLVGFQLSGFPDSQISKIWPLAGIDPGQAALEPSGPKNVDCLL